MTDLFVRQNDNNNNCKQEISLKKKIVHIIL